MLRAYVALFALGCSRPAMEAEPEPEPEPPAFPTGEFEAEFRFWLPAGFPWETQPRARFRMDGEGATGVIAEVWHVDTPAFSDCATALRFDAEFDWPSEHPWATFEGLADLEHDPCNLGPYGTGLPMVLTVIPLDEARSMLAEAADLDPAMLDHRQGQLEAERGQEAMPWFLFWGESADALWPVGHVFDAND